MPEEPIKKGEAIYGEAYMVGSIRAIVDKPRRLTGATTFQWYQLKAKRTMMRLHNNKLELSYLGLGLAGEAGEAVETLKKALYHGHDLDLDKLKKELGDVLWYAANIAEALGFELDEVAVLNIDKLTARYPEGFSSEASINRQENDNEDDQKT